MSGSSPANSRGDQVVAAVRDLVIPLRGRVERVEKEQQDHEARTQRQIDRMEAVATDALRSVTGHVERLAKLETIPERMNSLEGEVRSQGARITLLETRATEQAARLEGRRDVGRQMRWFAENWLGLAAIIGLLLFGLLLSTGLLKIQMVTERMYDMQEDRPLLRANPTVWTQGAAEKPVLRGRSE